MEVKKNPKYDLDKKRGLFFNFGLALSVTLVLASFEFIRIDKGIADLGTLDNEDEELILIPNTEILPPPPPPPKKIEIPKPVVVDDDEVIEDIEIEFDTEFSEDDSFAPVITEDLPDEKADVIFDIVEEDAKPMGGLSGFYNYVSKNIKYPSKARKMGIEGRVFLQFVVDIDGSITEVKVIKGIGAGCDEEAKKILEQSPKWSPGKQRGRPVKVRMVMPITFRLN